RRGGDAVAQALLRIVPRIKADQRLALDREQRRVVVVVVLEPRQHAPLDLPGREVEPCRDDAATGFDAADEEGIADAAGARPRPPAPGEVVDQPMRRRESGGGHASIQSHMMTYG